MERSNKKIQELKTWLASGSINVFGAPYAGKDTQCKMLAKLLGAEVIGSGDITRSFGSKNLKRQTEAGFLAPTDEFLELVPPYFSRKQYVGRPLILSSVGRWSGEEKPIIAAAAESHHPIKAAIFIHISLEAIWKRWEIAEQSNDRGERYDDDKEKLSVRLEEFRSKTLPVIAYYKSQGLLVEVDGHGSIDKVNSEILTGLSLLAK